MNRQSPKPSAPAPDTDFPVLLRRIDQPMIDAYAEVSGDHNPIHVDPEYARSGPFGRTIAHGLLTLACVAELLNGWSGGAFDENGELDITFIGPVYSGDELRLTGEVVETVQRDGVDCLRVRLLVTVGERAIVAGFALQPIPGTGA